MVSRGDSPPVNNVALTSQNNYCKVESKPIHMIRLLFRHYVVRGPEGSPYEGITRFVTILRPLPHGCPPPSLAMHGGSEVLGLCGQIFVFCFRLRNKKSSVRMNINPENFLSERNCDLATMLQEGCITESWCFPESFRSNLPVSTWRRQMGGSSAIQGNFAESRTLLQHTFIHVCTGMCLPSVVSEPFETEKLVEGRNYSRRQFLGRETFSPPSNPILLEHSCGHLKVPLLLLWASRAVCVSSLSYKPPLPHLFRFHGIAASTLTSTVVSQHPLCWFQTVPVNQWLSSWHVESGLVSVDDSHRSSQLHGKCIDLYPHSSLRTHRHTRSEWFA